MSTDVQVLIRTDTNAPQLPTQWQRRHQLLCSACLRPGQSEQHGTPLSRRHVYDRKMTVVSTPCSSSSSTMSRPQRSRRQTQQISTAGWRHDCDCNTTPPHNGVEVGRTTACSRQSKTHTLSRHQCLHKNEINDDVWRSPTDHAYLSRCQPRR